MATRGSIGFWRESETKPGYGNYVLAFQSSDSGPWGSGTDALNFINAVKKNSYRINKIKHNLKTMAYTDSKEMSDDVWKINLDGFLNAVLAGKVKQYSVKSPEEGGIANNYSWVIDVYNRSLYVYVYGCEYMAKVPWKYLPKEWPSSIEGEEFIEYLKTLLPPEKKKKAA